MTDREPDLAEFRALIEARRAEIVELMANSSSDRAPVELDQTKVGRVSRIDAIQIQAMAKAADSRRQTELRRLQSALKRIEDESFGECLACGAWIAEKRLRLDPGATLCIECASR